MTVHLGEPQPMLQPAAPPSPPAGKFRPSESRLILAAMVCLQKRVIDCLASPIVAPYGCHRYRLMIAMVVCKIAGISFSFRLLRMNESNAPHPSSKKFVHLYSSGNHGTITVPSLSTNRMLGPANSGMKIAATPIRPVGTEQETACSPVLVE